MITVVVGAPFAAKSWWIDREIERRESDGEIGLVHLSYSGVYGAIVPGAESVYRDARVSDSGAARYAAYVLRLAVGEAARRELNGYAAYDSPRLAVQVAQELGGASVVEVGVSETEALRRAQRHIELVSTLAPRAGAEDGKAAVAKCRQMVAAYFSERDVLDAVEVRQVRAPEQPSDNAIRYMWNAAIKAAKRGDTERRDKWSRAARRALAARGIAA